MDFSAESVLGVVTSAGGIGIAAAMFWLLVKKMIVKVAQDDTSLAATDAHAAVIEMLRAEVSRMSVSNKELGESLKQFQLENVDLRREISNLHETINALSEQINIVNRNKAQCEGCEFNTPQIVGRKVSLARNRRSTDSQD